MSLQSLSFNGRYAATLAIVADLKSCLPCTEPDAFLFLEGDGREAVLQCFNERCADLIHDLGGMAAAW